jgi:hypothetical protein
MTVFSTIIGRSVCQAALLGGLLLSGCKKEDAPPVLSGNLYGFVRTYDEFGRPESKSGVAVSLDNTSPLIQAVTNNAGRFELLNVPAGTYNASYTKAGYGLVRRLGFGHVGGTQPTSLPEAVLVRRSNTTLTNLTMRMPVPGGYPLVFEMLLNNPSTVGRAFGVRLFVGNSADVNASTGELVNATTVNLSAAPSSSGTVNLAIAREAELSAFHTLGYPPGSTAYVMAYPAPAALYDYPYPDPVTGRNVYSTLGTPSNIVRIVVP